MKHVLVALVALTFVSLAGCGNQSADTAAQTEVATAAGNEAPAAQSGPLEQAAETTAEPVASAAPAQVSETDDELETVDNSAAPATGASILRVADTNPVAPPSQFKEGTHYRRLVPAQPTSVSAGQVEIAEVFWYGCGHCYALDPFLESWRKQGKPSYVEFVRLPAMWNNTLRMHARVFYTADLLGKLEELHTPIFRAIQVNGDMLNTEAKVKSFFTANGISEQDFQKAYASFAVETKLQRAETLNQRYKVQSVPMIVVNGKYTTDVGSAGGHEQLIALLNELAARERGI